VYLLFVRQPRQYLVLAVQIPTNVWNKLGKRKIVSLLRSGRFVKTKLSAVILLPVLAVLRLLIKSKAQKYGYGKPGCKFPPCLI